jgi:protein-S-isoprenylcysteine O-methyltransferase Ste14
VVNARYASPVPGPSAFALLRSFTLPIGVTIVIPSLILVSERVRPVVGRVDLLGAVTGGPLVLVGLTLIAWTVSLFARKGRGTLAPWDPPRHLVVLGPYQHVRNPMITGVSIVVLGEALALHSIGLAAWGAAVVAINHVYFILSEEPGLRRRFGDEYERYSRNVPRWLPRLTA